MEIIPRILQTLIWIPTRLALKIFLRLKISGLENTKGFSSGVIFALNHQSELDPIILPACLNPFSKLMPMFYVSLDRSGYRHLGFKSFFYGGTFFRYWGAYPAVTGLKNYEESLRNHIALLRKGKSICVFPEGGKSKDGRLRNAKGGIVAMAKTTGRPVVPVAVSGYFGLTFKEFIFRKRSLVIRFGRAIQPAELFLGYDTRSADMFKTIADERVMGRIGEMLE